MRSKIIEHAVTVRLLVFSGIAIFGTSYVTMMAVKSGWTGFTIPFVALLLISLVMLFLYLRRVLVKPIDRLIRITDLIGQGRLDQRIKVGRLDEVGRLANSINQMTDLLEKQLAEVSLLNQICQESTLSRNLDMVLGLILEKAVSIQQADTGSIMLIDKANGDLIVKAVKNLDDSVTENTRTSVGQGIAGWVAQEGKPIVLIDGIGADGDFKNTKDVQNAVSLPVILDEKVVGVLNLGYHDTSGSKKFASGDLDFLITLTNQAASAINNAQLFEELRGNYLSTIQALATAIDAKDPYTHGHSARVAEYAIATAKELDMTLAQMEALQTAAYLHDIGKIAIPEQILSKPGKLTDEEYEVVKTHPIVSAKILSPVNFHGQVITIVRHHHERVDGTGYPDGVGRQDIITEARIMAIADSFDAMTSIRPYRPPRTFADAKMELIRYAGTQFDTDIVRAFIKAINKRESSGKKIEIII